MRVQIPLIGPYADNRSDFVSDQNTVNLYPEINPEGKNLVSLHAFPGLKEFADYESSLLSGPSRGIYASEDRLYSIVNGTLYEVGPNGGGLFTGGVSAINSGVRGPDVCEMSDNGELLVIANGHQLFLHTMGTTTFNTVTDTDVADVSTIDYLNSQFIFDEQDGDAFRTSQLTTTLSASNFSDTADTASAESYSDKILRVLTYNQLVYFFGSRSIEPWFNSGVGNPPFDREEGGIRPIGLAGKWSLASDDEAIFFLDNRRRPQKMVGLSVLPLGNTSLGKELDSYSTVADCTAMVYTIDNARFFQLNFPTANKSWCFHEPSGWWFQLSSGVNGERHRAVFHAYAFEKNIFADYENGKLYTLDFDTFTDDGATVQRKRTTANIHGGLFGVPGKELFYDRVYFDVEVGVGTTTGQGSDPQLMVRFSDDNGNTWSAEEHYSLGVGGNYTQTVELTQQGSSINRMYELTYSEPTRFSLISAYADISVGI